MGAFLALYLPQPMLPQLDRDLGTSPAVTGLVMTAGLLGFAAAGLMGEGDLGRTLRVAMLATVLGSVAAALSPHIVVLLAARAAQGTGVGLMVAGGLADVARRLPRAQAGRVTGALIAGTALGGLAGRALGYAGNFLTWRGAFVLGGAGVLAIVLASIRGLPLGPTNQPHSGLSEGRRAPLSLLLSGFFILFVSIGMFDLLPYRLSAPPFRLPPALADLVYLVFVPATVVGIVSGRAIDRWGYLAVTLVSCGAAVTLMLCGLVATLPTTWLAAGGAICGTIALNVAHSGAAAAYGRRAVGRYLAVYYVGGASAAPLLAASYIRFGWPGVVLPLCAATLVVAMLALARKQTNRGERQELEPYAAPPGTAS